ncbi:hypothetical protein H9Y04_43345 [Streptomyces sp. TRM66268-LWL]|uniref:Sugar ABC transporter permease n=1 Tax=Streptomyces polyasparticus TaxID=2767826 RepID=A0ABR7SXL2_9ACTN|nr:hypothetical protein [Streptomyces polyasparticus]MBC9719367.1 hypothetical protein [Streptomyces polyasparticus]
MPTTSDQGLPLFAEPAVWWTRERIRDHRRSVMVYSLPFTSALLLSALCTIAVSLVPGKVVCLRAGRGRHRRVAPRWYALRRGVLR